jgi:hypothetical protein
MQREVARSRTSLGVERQWHQARGPTGDGRRIACRALPLVRRRRLQRGSHCGSVRFRVP